MLQFRNDMQRLVSTQLFNSQYKAVMLAARFSQIATRPKAWKVQWWSFGKFVTVGMLCLCLFLWLALLMIIWWNKTANHGFRADVSCPSFPCQGCFTETFFLRFYRKYVLGGEVTCLRNKQQSFTLQLLGFVNPCLHYIASINGEE